MTGFDSKSETAAGRYSSINKDHASSTRVEDEKAACQHLEVYPEPKHNLLDAAAARKHKQDPGLTLLAGQRVLITEEQSRHVCRKIDRHILPVMFWVYALMILDKQVVGYGATFGMQKEAHLVGRQYSIISSSGFWAQLGWTPISALLIVKVPNKILATVYVTCWGIACIGMAFSKSYGTLLCNRFLLGLFEAGILPLWGIINASWYRRSEQPLRAAIWYSSSGFASIFGSLLAYGVSFASHSSLYVYQILFLTVGILTVLTGPLVFWRLPNNPAEASFLTEEERVWAVERLRDNNTGIERKEITWYQVWEALASPFIWLCVAVDIGVCVGAGTTSTFGTLILKGFGFQPRQALLLNIPFGVMQILSILGSSWIATRLKRKSILQFATLFIALIGVVILYSLGREKKYYGPLLLGYYLMGPIYATVPLVLSWLTANVAGHTKRAMSVNMYQAAGAAGNIVAPLLFSSTQAPGYYPGLRAVLGTLSAACILTVISATYLIFMNRSKEAQRSALGKPAKIVDLSMEKRYESRMVVDQLSETAGAERLGDQAFLDLSDMKNDEFVYTL